MNLPTSAQKIECSARTLTFLDLFCGCGGFTLGMIRSGFHCLAAIDNDPVAISALQTNLIDRQLGIASLEHALERDLTKFEPRQLAKLIGTDRVDVIVGGPPCQGFSTARQVDGANHGVRLKRDPRRNLYREFLRFVEYFQPRVFVVENVLGLRTAADGKYLTAVHHEARRLGRGNGRHGYRVHGQIEDAWELGVPQKRRRQLIIGVRADLPGYFTLDLKPAPRARPHTLLGAAIGDLPILRADSGEDERDYNLKRRAEHLRRHADNARQYLYDVLEIELAKKLTSHVARAHSKRDLRDFARLKEGESSAVAMRNRGVRFEFPYDKSNFKDRYTRQSRMKACSTIVAHLSKDGLMFIHPTQQRSLTVREAARVQTFPDWFCFPASRTHAFRLVGNAVPPLVSEAIGISVRAFLGTLEVKSKAIKFALSPLPKDEKEAVGWIRPLLDLSDRALRSMTNNEFKRAWYSVAFLNAGLHPASALDHGRRVGLKIHQPTSLGHIEPRLLRPYYKQSGWPVALAPIAKEAWRRYESGSLKTHEFYCSDAQLAGMCSRDTEHEPHHRLGRGIQNQVLGWSKR
jgi:DNA (cytosine-5)-methyltransferase 1